MFREINLVVAAWINVEFVSDVPRGEFFVERRSTRLETVVVFRTAIEIDFQSRKIRRARQHERIVALPERSIDGRAENAAKHSQARSPRQIRIWDLGKPLD